MGVGDAGFNEAGRSSDGPSGGGRGRCARGRGWRGRVHLVTRFLVVGHTPLHHSVADKTSIVFSLPNEPGALFKALSVFALFTYEGVKHHGPIGYVKSLMPGGVKGPIVGLIFPIEIMSNFLRLISLTVRLWANLLAGHLLIAFMGCELGVLVGDPWVSWFLLPAGVAIFMFEAVLIAGLQAFIFAILTAIYIGGAVESH